MLKQKSLDLISKPVIKVMFDLKKKKKVKEQCPKLICWNLELMPRK